MPDGVTLADVQRVAELARLGLSDAGVASLAEDLNAILGHMSVLASIDTRGIADAAPGASEGMRLREDRGGSVPLELPVSEIAPEMRDGFFIVPRLTSHEEPERGA